MAWASDFISAYVYGHSLELLKDDQRAKEWFGYFTTQGYFFPYFERCPWIIDMALKAPLAVTRLIIPMMAPFISLYKVSYVNFSRNHLLKPASQDVPAHMAKDSGIFNDQASLSRLSCSQQQIYNLVETAQKRGVARIQYLNSPRLILHFFQHRLLTHH